MMNVNEFMSLNQSTISFLDFMCRHCFHVESIRIKDTSYDFGPTKKLERLTDVYKPNVCPCCGMHKSMVYVDHRISPMIQSLNKKGYLTAFCCEGHVHNGKISKMYITFSKYTKSLRTLPGNWYAEPRDEYGENKLGPTITAEFFGCKFPYGTKIDDPEYLVMFAKEQNKLLNNLSEWVDSLPKQTIRFDIDLIKIGSLADDLTYYLPCNFYTIINDGKLFVITEFGMCFRTVIGSFGGRAFEIANIDEFDKILDNVVRAGAKTLFENNMILHIGDDIREMQLMKIKQEELIKNDRN